MSVGDRIRESVWERDGWAGRLGSLALRPASGLFGAAVALRNLGYRIGVLRSAAAPLAVVSVGNLAVGGTGKTPMTLWIARALEARGRRCGILLRGYGGRAAGVTVVSRGRGAEVGPQQAGDEAVMLAKAFDGPVVTARRRSEGARAMKELGCEVVLLDDGFQHRAIARLFDVVLIDGRRGPLLPAGPLREPLGALGRADAIVLVEKEAAPISPLPKSLASKPVYRMRLEARCLVESVRGHWSERPLHQLAARRVVAVAGIARPETFYELLHSWEAQIDEVFEFPDHHPYSQQDWQRIARGAREADLVVTTEKDLVKLEAYPFATGKLVALRIEPRVENGDALIQAILGRMTLERAAGRS
jgi:tetraacyldisaccharide 4'-kinase